jgi:hypothetical protein
VVHNLRRESSDAILAATLHVVDWCVAVAGSFMLRRFQDDVWPVLAARLSEPEPRSPAATALPERLTRFRKELLLAAFSLAARVVRGLERRSLSRAQGSLMAAAAARAMGRAVDADVAAVAHDVWLALAERSPDVVWLPAVCAARRAGLPGLDRLGPLPPADRVSPALPVDVPPERIARILTALGEPPSAAP